MASQKLEISLNVNRVLTLIFTEHKFYNKFAKNEIVLYFANKYVQLKQKLRAFRNRVSTRAYAIFDVNNRSIAAGGGCVPLTAACNSPALP